MPSAYHLSLLRGGVFCLARWTISPGRKPLPRRTSMKFTGAAVIGIAVIEVAFTIVAIWIAAHFIGKFW